jgi:hypothetical protein
MATNPRGLAFITTLTVAAAGLLGWQHHLASELRSDIDQQRLHNRKQAEQRTKPSPPAPPEPSAVDPELLAEQAAVAQLRMQLESMQRRVREAAAAAQTGAPAETPPLRGNVVPYSLWKNRGRATPAAALETALWSSAHGDINTLTTLLVFDTEARNEASTLFASLPGQLQQQFVSPERLVAVLAAKDVPLGSATILNEIPTPTETKVAAQIFDPEGKQKVAVLSLRSDDAGWRFVVPPKAVKRYADWLRAPPSVALEPLTTGGSPMR